MLKKIYDNALLDKEYIYLDDKKRYKVKFGKHAIYIPELEAKIIWSFNGKIESYLDWDLGRNVNFIRNQTFGTCGEIFDDDSLNSIANEYLIMGMLSKEKIAPPVKGLFYIKNMISDYPYNVIHSDPKGRYGYYIADANKLSVSGNYSFSTFVEKYISSGIIKASEGALGDLKKDGNSINGYLVDIRRTLWDMMRLKDECAIRDLALDIKYKELNVNLIEKIKKYGQFPFMERKQSYQSYYLNGVTVPGSRDTLYRYDKMEIDSSLTGKSILDLGCCYGAMCIEAYKRGARRITGIDNQKEFIDCARDLARANGFQINYQCMDLKSSQMIIDYIKSYYKEPLDIVFALSLYKHIKEKLWDILDNIQWKVCYLESHNAPKELETDHVKEMIRYLNSLQNTLIIYLGKTEDRSPRVIWRLER